MKEADQRITAIGRRKEARARVWLVAGGNGKVVVNGFPLDKYFLRETDRIIIVQPLVLTNNMEKFDVVANLCGGGLTGQAGALRLGISRALVSVDPQFKDILRKQGFLTRDPRAKERKKYGQKGARKRFQWTKR
ncbi:MAG: 30S ribosomal protein S9 [Candidatus Omnitrophica bacterium]|nr:30S ribosomal protein S9 [Candidatus Omnitrophota bacterium]